MVREKLDRDKYPDACPSCGGALWMQSSDCCAEFVSAPVEEVEIKEVLVEEEVKEVEELEEEEEESSDEEAYFDALPVKELRKLCKEANLSAKGRKSDLVARLIE